MRRSMSSWGGCKPLTARTDSATTARRVSWGSVANQCPPATCTCGCKPHQSPGEKETFANPLIVLKDTPAPPAVGQGKAVSKLLVMKEGPAPRGPSHYGDPTSLQAAKLDGIFWAKNKTAPPGRAPPEKASELVVRRRFCPEGGRGICLPSVSTYTTSGGYPVPLCFTIQNRFL